MISRAAEIKRTVDELTILNDIGKTLTSSLEISQVMTNIFEKVSELLRPRNWSLLLYDEEKRDLAFTHAVGAGADRLVGMHLPPHEGIAGWVFTKMEPLAVPDVRADPRFAARFDAISSFHTRSILAAPLASKGRCLGVVELVYGARDKSFQARDLRTLAAVADFAAIALDNARNYARVQEITTIDDHTGLFNARHLAATLAKEVDRATRFGHPVSLVFMDLDRFKAINDTHGHQRGSSTLREVGRLLAAQVRSVDVATRYGGDEFAIVLPETGKDQAVEMAEKMREEISKVRFLATEGLALRVTASFGVACFPDDTASADDLLQQADRAMYLAKAAGRNGVKAAERK